MSLILKHRNSCNMSWDVPKFPEACANAGAFSRLNERLNEVIAEMASEYVYYAPMRRQRKYHP